MVDNTIDISSAKGQGLSALVLTNTTGGTMRSAVTAFLVRAAVTGSVGYGLTDMHVFWRNDNVWIVGGGAALVASMIRQVPTSAPTPSQPYDNSLGVAFTPWLKRVVFAAPDGSDEFPTPEEAYEAARENFRIQYPDGAAWKALLGYRQPPSGNGTFSAVIIGVPSISPDTLRDPK